VIVILEAFESREWRSGLAETEFLHQDEAVLQMALLHFQNVLIFNAI
jgi:hypothetical protein